MILFDLFITFFKIGAFSFGGGYAMISLISEAILKHGWMNESEILSFIGVETVVPGPISVNMATFVGYQQAGFIGGLCATLGVILPSFIVILLISMALKNLLKYKPVQAFLTGIRPVVIGLIIATAVTMGISLLFNVETIASEFIPDLKSLYILASIIFVSISYKLLNKKPIPNALLIVVSGILGLALFI